MSNQDENTDISHSFTEGEVRAITAAFNAARVETKRRFFDVLTKLQFDQAVISALRERNHITTMSDLSNHFEGSVNPTEFEGVSLANYIRLHCFFCYVKAKADQQGAPFIGAQPGSNALDLFLKTFIPNLEDFKNYMANQRLPPGVS